VVLFENNKAYKFGLNSGDIDLFAENITLEKVTKTTPLSAAYIDGGYFIYTDQHTSFLTPGGKLATLNILLMYQRMEDQLI